MALYDKEHQINKLLHGFCEFDLSIGRAEAYMYDGEYHGLMTVRNEVEEYLSRGVFINNVLVGPFVFSVSGRKISEIVMNFGSKTQGVLYEYHNNGQLRSRTDMQMGVKHGSRSLYNEAGVLVGKGQLRNGEFHGLVQIWTDQGILLQEQLYDDGKLHGSSVTYFRNTNVPHFVHMYHKGDKNGAQLDFHRNGLMKTRRHYVNGVVHGPFCEWHDNGAISERGVFVSGRLDGFVESWRRSGQLIHRVFYTQDCKGWNTSSDKIQEAPDTMDKETLKRKREHPFAEDESY